MDSRELQETLGKLHAELQRGAPLDGETKTRLSLLLRDIHDVLDQEDVSRETSPPHGSLTERMQEAIADFEAAHPRVSELIGRIADGLSQLGI